MQNQEQQQQHHVQLPSQLNHPPHSALLKTSSNEVKSSNSQQLNPISGTPDLTNEPFFPPPPSTIELDSPLLNRDAPLPPSVKKTTSHSPDQEQTRAPPIIPMRTISEKPTNQWQPEIRARTVSAPIAPKPKPKPRPAQNIGKVRTASEYHAAELKSSISPSSFSKSNVIVEETEVVTASKSRGVYFVTGALFSIFLSF